MSRDVNGGALIVAGITMSFDFPTTPGAYDRVLDGFPIWDSYVAKLSAAGDSLLWATYIGGGGNDLARGVATDGLSRVYCTGQTYSANFPTSEDAAYDETLEGSSDAFLIKLSSDGSTILFSTFLGDTLDDGAYGIAVTPTGKATIVGGTTSGNQFPVTPSAFNTWADTASNSNIDGFVTRFNHSGSALDFSGLLNGGASAQDEEVEAVVLGPNGDTFVTGYTGSWDFRITAFAYRVNIAASEWDGFVARINNSGTDLVYSTYLGYTQANAEGKAIDVDAEGNAYVAGRDIIGGLGSASQAFFAKFDAWGTERLAWLEFGGDLWETARGIQATPDERAVIVGNTFSSDFPIIEGTPHNDLEDAFLVEVNAAGTGLSHATCIGGTDDDFGFAVLLDGDEWAYVVGSTLSPDFPGAAETFDTSHNGEEDAFLLRYYFGQSLVGVGDAGTSGEDPVGLTATPNPIRGSGGTTVRLTWSEASGILDVFDSTGRHVRTLRRGLLGPGVHEVPWDGKDGAGGEVPSGVYLLRARANRADASRKVVIVR